MYHWLYNLGIRGYTMAISIAALFNPKARAWVEGRRNLTDQLRSELDSSAPLIWFHAASLGEAEQGVPVMRALKKRYPDHRILLSFFSPSGMENFHQPELTDHVCYLPADLPNNARGFVEIIKPVLAVFIKYEIWANYFLELQRRRIPVMIAPAIFRPDQFYFREPHTSFFLPILRNTAAILTQDEGSVELLRAHGVLNCRKVGDSRFERVMLNAKQAYTNPVLDSFASQRPLIVCGSTWSPDEKILLALSKAIPDLKMIIAPHDISVGNVKRIQRLFGDHQTFLYSQPPADTSRYRFVIIDNIGMLSKIYRLGQLAYVGGAFGSGIHNSLEAVVYGVPVFFGPKHSNFIEPSAMIRAGFGHEVRSADELIQKVKELLNNPGKLETQSQAARKYIEDGTGATKKIMAEIDFLLS